MSIARNLSVNGRQNSLNSVYGSSMESLSGELSGSHGVDSCWCHIDQQLAPMNTVYTVPRLRIKTLHYDTCAVEYSDEKKHSKKGGNRVRKVIRMIFL